METLTSRKSAVIRSFRALAGDAALREEKQRFVCDGQKLLEEALRSGLTPETVLWKEKKGEGTPVFPCEYVLPAELFDYVSPMKNSPGPLFTLPLPIPPVQHRVRKLLALETVQDPGNVGTVLRTADAFGIDLVVLLDGCADLYAPKTVRAAMGAVFRQPAISMDRERFVSFCHAQGLPLYGAALSGRAQDIRDLALSHAAVVIGSEGQGLSRAMLDACDGELIIPMPGKAESLNAAVAASVIMWEMQRG